MNPLISSQQAYFFSHHGYIEFDEVFSSAECDTLQAHLHAALFARLKRSIAHIPPHELYVNGRDLWRQKQELQTLLLSRKMTSFAFGLTHKTSLHLACDQWIPSSEQSRAVKAKDLFSIQGLSFVYFIRLTAPSESEVITSTFQLEPGLIPLPSQRGAILVVNPNLLLNWPRFSLYQTDLYAVAYALPNAVYYHNKEDPCNSQLKTLGYNFGDRLVHAHHPLIQHSK